MPRTDEAAFFERHVEKAVLGATAVILVLVLAFWVVSSPREIKLAAPGGVQVSKEVYAPGEVDAALREMAEQAARKLAAVKPPDEPVPAYPGLLREEFLAPDRGLFDYVPLRSGRPVLKLPADRPDGTKAELASMLPLPAPDRPVAAARREVVTVLLTTPEGIVEEPRELVAAHVVAVFDHGAVLKKWWDALKETNLRAWFVVLGVEAQRRQLLPDGKWSDPAPVAMVRVPAEAPFEPLPKHDGKNYDEVSEAIYSLAQLDAQRWLVEPGYYTVYRAGEPAHWMDGKPRTRVSDLEEVVPETVTPAPTPSPTAPRPVPRRTVPRGPTGYPSGVRPAYDGTSRGRSGPAYDGGSRRPPPSAPVGRNYPPDRPGYATGQPTIPPRRTGAEPAQPVEAEKTARVPRLRDQLAHPKGILELWFHDTSLAEQVTYSYRVRLVLGSPLFGQSKDVKKPEDADVLQLTTPWSEWSEGVSVKSPTEFFLVGDFPPDRVLVRVFTEKWGRWIAERFTVRRGQPIGKDVVKELVQLRGEPRQTAVSFDTGAVAVDFDFDRKVWLPRSGISRTTPELLYLDAEGKLRSRTRFHDDASALHKELQSKLQERAP